MYSGAVVLFTTWPCSSASFSGQNFVQFNVYRVDRAWFIYSCVKLHFLSDLRTRLHLFHFIQVTVWLIIRGFRFLYAGFYCPRVPYFIPRKQNGSIMCFLISKQVIDLKYHTAMKRTECNIYQESRLNVFECLIQLGARIAKSCRRYGKQTLDKKKINFLSSPTGIEAMTFQKYRLDALTTELWRAHGEQGGKLGFYVSHMSCHTARLK